MMGVCFFRIKKCAFVSRSFALKLHRKPRFFGLLVEAFPPWPHLSAMKKPKFLRSCFLPFADFSANPRDAASSAEVLGKKDF
jgi:hypothetical protein